MINIENSYKTVTEKAWFDINAGQNIPNLPLDKLVENIVEHLDKGNKGCCFHCAVYLSKLLNDSGIYSEIVITPEPTQLEDGTVRIDNRASVLYYDEGEKAYFVANPIEDVEAFEKYNIAPANRKEHYKNGTCELTLPKDKIYSQDASKIPLEKFTEKYGNGNIWTMGTLFRKDSDIFTFYDMFSSSSKIKLDDLSDLNEKFNIAQVSKK